MGRAAVASASTPPGSAPGATGAARGPRLVLALLGLVLGVLLLEGLARLRGDRLCIDQGGVFYQADARVGWLHVPGLAGFVERCRGTFIPPVPFAVNARGLLDPERPLAKPPGTARIAVVGGNVAEGLGVREGFTFARLLEQHADRRRGAPLEVLNASVGGWALDNGLLWLRHEGFGYAPDLILVVLNPVVELPAVSPPLARALGMTVPLKPYFTLQGGRLVSGTMAVPAAAPAAPGGLLAHAQLGRILMRLPSRTGPPFGVEPAADGPRADPAIALADAEALARRLLDVLRDEAAAAGARVAVVVAPAGAGDSGDQFEHGEQENLFIEMARAAGLPVTSLGPTFRWHRDQTGRLGYLPEMARWNRDGHFMAAEQTWNFLVGEGLLPDRVVPVRVLGGGRVPDLADFPARVWRARHTLFPTFVQAGLVLVCVVWAGALLPARGRELLLVAASLGAVAALSTPVVAALGLGLVLAVWAAVEWLPARFAPPLLIVLLGALAAWPVLRTPQWVPRYDADAREVMAALTGVALLKLVAYAVDRRAGAPRRPLRAVLAGMVFFPTVLNGPIEPVELFHARRHPGGVAPASWPALGAHLGRSALALGRLAGGVLKVHVATLLLNTLGPDVFASGGSAVGVARLWLWVLELPLYLYLALSGFTDVAVALGRMVGSAVTENFDAPWAARDAADLWRRFHVSLGAWLRRYVYEPLGAGGGATGWRVAAVFAASALWYTWGAVKLVGPSVWRPSALLGFLAWGLASAAAVVAAHRLGGRGRGPGRVLGGAVTLGVLALACVPFFLPPWLGLAACGAVVLRLLGLR